MGSLHAFPQNPAPQVWVVDDDRHFADSLSRLVLAKGFPVSTFCDPREALACLEVSTPAIALLDINMPEVSGYELARCLRSKCRDRVLLVAITALEGPMHEAAVNAAGFDHQLTKPPDFRSLFHILETRAQAARAAD
jgi:DNA-binding response OmpR family regulator